MSWSLKLITIRGIPVRVHATFLLILVWAAWLGLRSGGPSLRSVAFLVGFVLLIFVCVVLHELGHSLAAQLFDVRVEDITLWPVGGVARMAQMPRRPSQEFLITAAGPAVNVLLAIGLGAVTLAVIGPNRVLELALSTRRLNQALAAMDLEALLLLLTANNIALVLFNLIPAFPMDGGRLLRSLLAAFLPFARATRVATVIGQVLATLIGMVALFSGNYMLALVGLFVFLAAGQERAQTTALSSLEGLRVRQAMQPVGLRLSTTMTLLEAAQRIAASPQAFFLVVDGERMVGGVSRGMIVAGLRRPGPAALLAQVMWRDLSRAAPGELLTEAHERLNRRPGQGAVVVAEGQVVGLLSPADLLRLAEIAEAAPQAVRTGPGA